VATSEVLAADNVRSH